MHEQIGQKTIKRLSSLHTLSDLDSFASTELYGFQSQEEYEKACPDMGPEFLKKINIPYLAIQPKDDPLHMVC